MGSKSGQKSGKGGKQGGKSNGSKGNSAQNIKDNPEGKEEPDSDLSVLRKPIQISASGLKEAVKVYQTGTEEMQHLLSHECDIVYECKVCRSLFRSLANFVSHKRVYCREQYCEEQHLFQSNYQCEDHAIVIQPEPPRLSLNEEENWQTSDVVSVCNDVPDVTSIETVAPRILEPPNTKKKALNFIVEKLAKKVECSDADVKTVGEVSASKFYEAVNENLSFKKNLRKDTIIHLEPIENTTSGVFQTVVQSPVVDSDDLMKAQVSELQEMSTEVEAMLGPDGQILSSSITATSRNGGKQHEAVSDRSQSHNPSGSSNHVCTICNTRFSTRKTLNHHMKSLHVTFRMCYPCPCCKSTFFTNWSVYRHLYKVHRKSSEQVRKLRAQIQMKAFRKEMRENESSNKTGQKETAAQAALKEQKRIDLENQAWMSNFEEDVELQMCGGCGRRFERRAALNSHSQLCQKRIAAKNKVSVRRAVAAPATVTGCPEEGDEDACAEASPTAPAALAEQLPETDQVDELAPLEVQVDSHNSATEQTPEASPGIQDSTSQGTQSPALGRPRHSSGNWSETSCKKDIPPEKRIEIQIRRDYCKSGTSSPLPTVGSAVSHTSQDGDQDVTISRDPSKVDGYVPDMKNETKSDIEIQTYSAVVNSSENVAGIVNCFQKLEDVKSKDIYIQSSEGNKGNTSNEKESHLDVIKGEKNGSNLEKLKLNGLIVEKIKVIKQFDMAKGSQSKIDIKNVPSQESTFYIQSGFPNKKMLQGLDFEAVPSKLCGSEEYMTIAGNGNFLEKMSLNQQVKQKVDADGIPNLKKNVPKLEVHHEMKPGCKAVEEHYSPIMERKLQSLINIRMLQCLSCEKIFNNLTNLRRHVAVHIGWHRYQCIVCSFKCFEKFDCVGHVAKMHLDPEDRSEALTMVLHIKDQEQCAEVNCHSVEVHSAVASPRLVEKGTSNKEAELVDQKQDPPVGITLCPSKRREELLSPAMEKKMLTLVDRSKMECLFCHRRYNKFTRLRRHVAIHIGWHRYECIVCSFKCFDKCDCISHAAKEHVLDSDRVKAACLVRYLETQDEINSDSKRLDVANFVATVLKNGKEPMDEDDNVVEKVALVEKDEDVEEEDEDASEETVNVNYEDNNQEAASYNSLLNNPSTSKKKEENYCQVLERKMNEYINRRQLQCLPCNKKFLKLTNLRRHVARHIGWVRYQCVMCPFKCFAKYNCVGHVMKTHLDGSDRSAADKKVIYLNTDEQLKTAGNIEGFGVLATKSICPKPCKFAPVVPEDQLSYSSGVPNEKRACLSKPRQFQKLRTVRKSIFQFPKSRKDSVRKFYLNKHKVVGVISSEAHMSHDTTVARSSQSKRDTASQENNQPAVNVETSEIDVDIKCESDEKHQVVVNNPFDAENDIKVANVDDLIEENCGDKLIKKDDLTFESVPKSSEDENTVICASQETEENTKEKVISTTATEMVAKMRETLKRKCGNLEDAGLEAVPRKRVAVWEEQTSKIVTVADSCSLEAARMTEFPADVPADCLVSPSSPSNDECLLYSNDDNIFDTKVAEKKAIRDMVMQVIFGPPPDTESGEDGSNIFTVTVNSNLKGGMQQQPSHTTVHEDCSLVKVESSTSESVNIKSFTSATDSSASDEIDQKISKIESRRNSAQNHPGADSVNQRRVRPVRNRVKVEREDFIYDLSDVLLQNFRRDCEDSKSKKAKQQNDQLIASKTKSAGDIEGQQSLRSSKETSKPKPGGEVDGQHLGKQVKEVSSKTKSSIALDSVPVKCIPKLMLVRTDMSTYCVNKSEESGEGLSVTECVAECNIKMESEEPEFNKFHVSTRNAHLLDTKPPKLLPDDRV